MPDCRQLRRRTRVPRSCFCIAAFVWGGGCASEARPDHALLEFKQAKVVQVPDTFAVTDVASGDRGSVVLVSRSKPYVLASGRDGNFVEVGAGVLARPLGAFTAADGAVHVADGELNALLRIQGNVITDYVSLDRFGSLLAATRTLQGAWMMLAKRQGATTLLELQRGDMVPRVIVGAVPLDLGSTPRLATTAAGDIFLSVAERPGVVWRASPDGTRARVLVYPSLEDRGNGAAVTPLWVAAGLVPLGNHLLYTVADLRSDRRIIVLLDGEGVMVRTLEVNAPLAFAASGDGDSIVIALRAINVQELVHYRWNWRGR